MPDCARRASFVVCETTVDSHRVCVCVCWLLRVFEHTHTHRVQSARNEKYQTVGESLLIMPPSAVPFVRVLLLLPLRSRLLPRATTSIFFALRCESLIVSLYGAAGSMFSEQNFLPFNGNDGGGEELLDFQLREGAKNYDASVVEHITCVVCAFKSVTPQTHISVLQRMPALSRQTTFSTSQELERHGPALHTDTLTHTIVACNLSTATATATQMRLAAAAAQHKRISHRRRRRRARKNARSTPCDRVCVCTTA